MRLKKYVAVFCLSLSIATSCGTLVHAEDNNVAISTETAQENTSLENNSQKADTGKEHSAQDKKQVSKKNKTAKIKKGSSQSYSKSELRYMASIIYCEAGNQSYAGKLAVGIVVKNRMESKTFPNSIKGVLYQKKQFTPTRNGSLKRALKIYDKNGFKTKSYSSCLKAAKESLSGVKTVKYGGKNRNMKGYYFFSKYVSGCRLKIGAHMFK